MKFLWTLLVLGLSSVCFAQPAGVPGTGETAGIEVYNGPRIGNCKTFKFTADPQFNVLYTTPDTCGISLSNSITALGSQIGDSCSEFSATELHCGLVDLSASVTRLPEGTSVPSCASGSDTGKVYYNTGGSGYYPVTVCNGTANVPSGDIYSQGRAGGQAISGNLRLGDTTLPVQPLEVAGTNTSGGVVQIDHTGDVTANNSIYAILLYPNGVSLNGSGFGPAALGVGSNATITLKAVGSVFGSGFFTFNGTEVNAQSYQPGSGGGTPLAGLYFAPTYKWVGPTGGTTTTPWTVTDSGVVGGGMVGVHFTPTFVADTASAVVTGAPNVTTINGVRIDGSFTGPGALTTLNGVNIVAPAFANQNRCTGTGANTGLCSAGSKGTGCTCSVNGDCQSGTCATGGGANKAFSDPSITNYNAINIGTLADAHMGTITSIRSTDATAPMVFAGKVMLGGTTAPTDDLDFDNAANKVIAIPAQTVNTNPGRSLTINSGAVAAGGTDKGGNDIVLSTGITTGVGTANVKIQTPNTQLATGTATNAVNDRIFVSATTKNMTANNTLTSIFLLTIPAGVMAGGTGSVTCEAKNATDFQASSAMLSFAGVNKSGTATCSAAINGTSTAVSTGTFTLAAGGLASGNNCLIQVSANTNLSSPTTNYPRCSWIVFNSAGLGGVTITPQ